MYMKLDLPNKKERIIFKQITSAMGPLLWNDISNEVKQCVNNETFKKKLKTFLFNEF